MDYQISFTTSATKQFKKLPHILQKRLSPHIDALAKNPRPPGVKKLQAEESAYRIRIGDYRILYEIRDRQLLIIVVKITHRRSAY